MTDYIFLAGVLFGCCLCAIAVIIADLIRSRRERRTLPPATRKQIRRAARANRAQLRVLQGGDQRRWVPPANGDFDNEDTR